ncbi:MAG: hypothetical protein CMJ65_16040 [Planctomycetaceae bacterium]|jgi:hypothetical protein|nr:hypothetical protein [Planctomycetaceae bacterium]MDP7274096.1 NERD domain-containing protein/DEAD/DEAH box helicase [Planctomycetaceae bacterium]
MARMIPPACPPGTPSGAERALFTALEESLADDWTVIHSLAWLDDTGRRLQQGECDFLLLHPTHGLLAIEAKSGPVVYNATRQRWERRGRPINKDPFLQAQRSVHTLNGLLCRDVAGWNRSGLPFGYAAALTDCDRLIGTFPPHVSPDLVILRQDLEQIEDRLVQVLGRFYPPGERMERALFDRAVERLLPEFQVVRTLTARFTEQQQTLNRLTVGQVAVMESMRRNHRLLVEGCAGSGKTVLALEKAVRLEAAGSRVLLVCYNILLAEWLRREARERGAEIDVFHFHGLCEHVVKKVGGEFRVPRENESDFWNVTAPEMLQDALAGYGQRYDAVLVDEAQDFCEHWWIPLEELLVDSSVSRFYLFHDPRQNIFGHENALPMTEPVLVLDVNCRNAPAIAEFVHDLAGIEAGTLADRSDGLPPVELEVADEVEEREAVGRVLHELIDEQGLAPDRIVIVGRYRFENSVFAEQTDLDGIRVANGLETSDPRAVRYVTVYRFKGLEADCVLLTGFRPPSPESYVAASRARQLLHVFHRRPHKQAG